MIRDINPTDARILSQIHQECFAESWSVATFEKLLQDVTTWGWLFMAKDVPMGFVLGRLVLDEAEILTFAVRPIAQRQGMGKKLLRHCQKNISDQSSFSLFLEVEVSNVAAIQLYEKEGFCMIGMRKDYYEKENGARTAAYVMVWQQGNKI